MTSPIFGGRYQTELSLGNGSWIAKDVSDPTRVVIVREIKRGEDVDEVMAQASDVCKSGEQIYAVHSLEHHTSVREDSAPPSTYEAPLIAPRASVHRDFLADFNAVLEDDPAATNRGPLWRRIVDGRRRAVVVGVCVLVVGVLAGILFLPGKATSVTPQTTPRSSSPISPASTFDSQGSARTSSATPAEPQGQVTSNSTVNSNAQSPERGVMSSDPLVAIRARFESSPKSGKMQELIQALGGVKPEAIASALVDRIDDVALVRFVSTSATGAIRSVSVVVQRISLEWTIRDVIRPSS